MTSRRQQSSSKAAFTLIELLACQPKPPARGPQRRRQAKAAFTLIELLVVIAVIAVLAGLLFGGVTGAMEASRSTTCLNNLRQMLIRANQYAADNGGELPPARSRDPVTGAVLTWEHVLWPEGTDFVLHQCPAFDGEAMWGNDRYTGYNYNASYLGVDQLVVRRSADHGAAPSTRFSQIRTPAECAVFGDGQYAGGANKFMRSPYPGRFDPDASSAIGGTQGFRHRDKTHVAFADGHVAALASRHTVTAGYGRPADGCGFLSDDNRLYDLE